MNLIKKYGSVLAIMSLFVLIFLLFIVILNYTSIINKSALAICKIVAVILSFFLGGFIMGIKSNKKGWLEGFKISGIMILLFIIINLIFIHSFHLKYLLYYLILFSSSIFGSIIGINKKEAD